MELALKMKFYLDFQTSSMAKCLVLWTNLVEVQMVRKVQGQISVSESFQAIGTNKQHGHL